MSTRPKIIVALCLVVVTGLVCSAVFGIRAGVASLLFAFGACSWACWPHAARAVVNGPGRLIRRRLRAGTGGG